MGRYQAGSNLRSLIEKGIFFVCPDGKNTWYWDSPLNADVRYETFISNELVKYVDSHYKTVADRKGRVLPA